MITFLIGLRYFTFSFKMGCLAGLTDLPGNGCYPAYSHTLHVMLQILDLLMQRLQALKIKSFKRESYPVSIYHAIDRAFCSRSSAL